MKIPAPLLPLLPLLLPFTLMLLNPVEGQAAEHALKADKTRSFLEVDVKATLHSFTAHLDTYETKFTADDAGKLKAALLSFKFTDLKTGDHDRDMEMIKWLGGGVPDGHFELGILALAPDGQGQVTGRLTFHGQTQLIEFSVNALRTGDTYTIIGETTLDYRNWGLKVFKKDFVLKVDPEVKVRFKLTVVPVDNSPLTGG
ncbi:MAG: YceI family protein [Opitutales bacterium]